MILSRISDFRILALIKIFLNALCNKAYQCHNIYFTEIGTLSKDDDDGSENDGKKMNLRSLKLNRVYLDPLNMSNTGDFSWS